ncbi:hypothetical protein [Clostridium baratii]|uniref:hypothetical protein n=1 Tax=Clostridium baratii TaxID=1561 RepID=UPI001C21E22D|nr:hypothetical protein [Clostridium baratii]
MIKCKLIIYNISGHLSQCITGFKELDKKEEIKVVSVKYKKTEGIPYVKAIFNNNINVIYDMNDSGNVFVDKKNLVGIDYYFKRSFDSNIKNKYIEKIKPLGFNYEVYSRYGDFRSKGYNLLKYIVNILKGKKNKKKFIINDFEADFIKSDKNICFLTRLWDPNDQEVENEEVKKEREEINKFRVECIRLCKKNFGDRFIGGVENTEFSRKFFPDCIVKNDDITKRENFLKIVKSSSICIATTGLHKSIGWKFGEYLAASRAIISEKLYYEVPGDFKEGENYMQFSTPKELVEKIKILLDNDKTRINMMNKNKIYYDEYLIPDKLILNTLKEIGLK